MVNINYNFNVNIKRYYKDSTIKLIEIIMNNHDIKNNIDVSIFFVSNSEMKKINSENRNKEKETDIISFEYFDNLKDNKYDSVLDLDIGEIYLSEEYVKDQASDIGNTFKEELMFLICHGILHLLGYDHMNKDEEKIMIEKQKEIINEFKSQSKR